MKKIIRKVKVLSRGKDRPSPVVVVFLVAALFLVPFFGVAVSARDVSATNLKPCKSGYYRSPQTNRCRKKKVCRIGYSYVESDNSCKKIRCSAGYSVQDGTNQCKRIVCRAGYLLNKTRTNCVKNNNPSYKICPKGSAFNVLTNRCKKIYVKEDVKFIKNDNYSVYGTEIKGVEISTSDFLEILKQAKANKARNREILRQKGLIKSVGIIHSIANVKNSVSMLASLSVKQIASAETDKTVSSKDNAKKQKTCPEGKFLNPKTNRCKNIITTVTGKTTIITTTYDIKTGEPTSVKTCTNGYYLEQTTNRCKKIVEETGANKDDITQQNNKTTSLEKSTKAISKSSNSQSGSNVSKKRKTCPEGKFLNPKTNRCKKMEVVSETSTGKTTTVYNSKTGEAKVVKTCKDDYELSSDTNRCVKKKNNIAASDALNVPKLGGSSDATKSFDATGVVIGAVAIGAGVVIFEFRGSIKSLFKKLK